MSTATYRVAEKKCATCRWWHKVIVVMGVTMTVHVGLAQGMASLALSDSTRTAAQKSETLKVRGTGHGTSEEDALRDAYRDAIERAVGLYVDAELAAENDELIQDKILTQSNAYIEKYRKTSTRVLDNRLYEVKIVAEVRKQELTAKMTSVMPPKVISLNDDLKRLHDERLAAKQELAQKESEKRAKEMSQEKRDADAAALLRNELQDFNPSALMLDIGVADQKPSVSESSGELTVSVELNLRLATEKFHKVFAPKLKRVLDQITLKDPVRFSFIISQVTQEEKVARPFFDTPTANITSLPLKATWNRAVEIDGISCTLPACSIFINEYPNHSSNEPAVWLVESIEEVGAKSRVYIVGYFLADSCIKALYEVSRKWRELPPVDFVAELLTTSSNVITSQKFKVIQDCGWIGWGNGLKEDSGIAFYILPWMTTSAGRVKNYRFCNGGYWDEAGNFMGTTKPTHRGVSNAERYVEAVPFSCSFKVLESELPRVASVRVRPAK